MAVGQRDGSDQDDDDYECYLPRVSIESGWHAEAKDCCRRCCCCRHRRRASQAKSTRDDDKHHANSHDDVHIDTQACRGYACKVYTCVCGQARARGQASSPHDCGQVEASPETTTRGGKAGAGGKGE